MSFIIGAHTAFPKHRYSQENILEVLCAAWPDHAEVLQRLRKTSGVENRNLVMPLEKYRGIGGFETRNSLYIQEMLGVLEQAVLGLQEKTAFAWSDLCAIVSTTITGIAVPSLDARLMNRLPIPKNILRTPLFGLGCMGGVSSLNRAHDILKAYPDKLALVLATEACSLTFQLNDASMQNFVATSLFGDGSAAVLLAGDQHPLAKKANLKIQGVAASFYPDSERIMGWDMVDSGFKIVLSGNVPDIVRSNVGTDVSGFLEKFHLQTSDIKNIISHPGGPKVLKALAEVLDRPDSSFQHSWDSLRDQGNLSSVSVLNVLQRSMETKTMHSGPTLALAMGPAFNSELILMETNG